MAKKKIRTLQFSLSDPNHLGFVIASLCGSRRQKAILGESVLEKELLRECLMFVGSLVKP
ncbi:hypothetical protein SDJN02_17677, partial [Cucurbita argyrosperma subsp. argyrosperma]